MTIHQRDGYQIYEEDQRAFHHDLDEHGDDDEGGHQQTEKAVVLSVVGGHDHSQQQVGIEGAAEKARVTREKQVCSADCDGKNEQFADTNNRFLRSHSTCTIITRGYCSIPARAYARKRRSHEIR